MSLTENETHMIHMIYDEIYDFGDRNLTGLTIRVIG